MANIKSSKKSIRKIAKLTMRNKAEKSRIKTASKKLKTLQETGSAEAIKAAAKALMSVVDKAGKHGVWHDNKVNRIKSRLTPLIVKAAPKADSATEVISAEPSAVESTEAVEAVEDKAVSAETATQTATAKTISKKRAPARKGVAKKFSSKKPTASKTEKTSSKASE